MERSGKSENKPKAERPKSEPRIEEKDTLEQHEYRDKTLEKEAVERKRRDGKRE
jgi:hypothetical protein